MSCKLVEWHAHRPNDAAAVAARAYPSFDDARHWATSHSGAAAWVIFDARGVRAEQAHPPWELVEQAAATPRPWPEHAAPYVERLLSARDAEAWQLPAVESTHRKAHRHYEAWRTLVRAHHGV